MRVKFIFLIVVLVAGALFYMRSIHTAPVTEEVPSSATVAPKTEVVAPRERERALYAAPRSAVAPATAKKEDLKPECVAFWDKLRGLDLQKTFNEGATAESPFPLAGPCQTVPKELELAHKQFEQFCGAMPKLQKLPRQQADIPLAQCQTMSLLYRAKIADWLTRDVALKDITDTKILADKLLARFADNPAGAAQVAEQMLDRDPDLAFAAKAAAIGRFMDAQATASGNPKDPKWNLASDSSGRLDRLKDGDKAVADEVRLLGAQRRESDPKVFRDEAAKIADKDPSSWVGPYYAAWGEHKLGNKGEALKWLDQCLKNLPGEARCKAGKENLAKGGETPFESHLTFGLNPLEK